MVTQSNCASTWLSEGSKQREGGAEGEKDHREREGRRPWGQ